MYLFYEVGVQVSCADDIDFTSRSSIKKKKKNAHDGGQWTLMVASTHVFCDIKVLYLVFRVILDGQSHLFVNGRATVASDNFRLNSVNSNRYKIACEKIIKTKIKNFSQILPLH